MESFVFFCVCFIGWPVVFIFWLYMLAAGRILSRPNQANIKSGLIPLVGTIFSIFILIDLGNYLIEDIAEMMERTTKARHFKKYPRSGSGLQSSGSDSYLASCG